MEPAYIYRSTLIRVIDGDTYLLDLDLGFRVHAQLMIRLQGYSCEELNTPKGIEAAKAIATHMSNKLILVKSYKDRQTFARWVADVYVDGQHVGKHLLSLGLATVTT